ncbi:hypothetical protein MMC25_000169 [Agyrium rufum]|nr:hypothetical protein [Agyrium rufum]
MADSTEATATASVPVAENVLEDAPETTEEKVDTEVTSAESKDATMNGHTDPDTITNAEAEKEVENEDTVMEDVPEAGESAQNATTPVSKKAINGSASSKKKSSGVPEHKSKKLNRKKSKPALRLDVKPGELYLARMKGHPPWPSIICDEDMLPQTLLSSRPVTTAMPDGSYRRPEYADGGKRVYERTYPIMFLRTNEFAWIPNTELNPLDPEDCKSVPEKGKQKALIEAYGIASESHDLAYFKQMLKDHMSAIEEDLRLQAEKAAEREAKKAKAAKRKSGVADTEEVEEDEMEVDEEGEAKSKSKKRKKSDESETEEKPAKTPKTATKLKLSTPKTPAAVSSTKKAAKPKSSKKAAAKTNGEEEAEETPKVEEKPLSPAEAKEKKEKEIKYYRHKLQKGFLSRDTPPDDEETKTMSSFLMKLEAHTDLEGSIIRATKIHKVLKAMIRLNTIPLDEQYHFRTRCHSLLALWNKTLADDPNAGAEDKADGANGDKDEKEPASAPATNGIVDSAAAESAAAPETIEEPVENKIGTTVEGEKEAEKGDDAAPAAVGEKTNDEPVDAIEEDIQEKPEEAFVPPAETAEITA